MLVKGAPVVLLCFVMLWLHGLLQWIHIIHQPISFRVTSLALGQS